MRPRHKDLRDWQKLVHKIKAAKKEVKVGIIGKYFTTGDFTLSDAYISVIEAVKHSAWYHNREPHILWLNSEAYERDPKKLSELKELDGIIIPGGFGTRGVEGKILAIKFAREHKIPYLGLCYGMQLAVVEFARNVCGLKDAHTTEINPQTKNPVIHIMSEQENLVRNKKYGGTMRLGAYPCVLTPQSTSRSIYGTEMISERHRHRYEFNNAYREIMTKRGLVLAGLSPAGNLVEIIELSKQGGKKQRHPFFVGSQFHPEFKSRPLNPHPLFREFIKMCLKK
jgi:CTP synthase